MSLDVFSVLCYSGCDNAICVWNVGTGELVYQLTESHPDLIYSVSWNKDGSAVCTVCKDKALRVIDPRRGTVLKVIIRLYWLYFNPLVICPIIQYHRYSTLVLVYCVLRSERRSTTVPGQ